MVRGNLSPSRPTVWCHLCDSAVGLSCDFPMMMMTMTVDFVHSMEYFDFVRYSVDDLQADGEGSLSNFRNHFNYFHVH